MSKERGVAPRDLLKVMEAAAQYREFADKCDRLVEEAKNPQHKLVLQEMAQAWRNLADEQDGKKTR